MSKVLLNNLKPVTKLRIMIKNYLKIALRSLARNSAYSATINPSQSFRSDKT